MIQCNILNRLLKQVWTESSVPILSVCHFYITPGRATKTLAVMHQRLCGQAVSITGEWPSGWHSGSDWRHSEGELWVSKTLHSSPLSCGLWSKTGRWAKETDAKWLFPWCIIIPWKQKKTPLNYSSISWRPQECFQTWFLENKAAHIYSTTTWPVKHLDTPKSSRLWKHTNGSLGNMYWK